MGLSSATMQRLGVRAGDFVRAHIPVSYSDWRDVPQNFIDDVWTALMGEFELNVPAGVARPLMDKSWSQKFRTYKNTLRTFLKNGDPRMVPKGVDPNIWRKFVENESEPKKKLQNKRNSENRKKLKSSHCLGRRTYAQKEYMMKQKNPTKENRRVDTWLVALERSDGNVLASAKVKYDEVKEAQNRRKVTNMGGEGCSNICLDIETDELVEAFRKDKGKIHGMGSHVTKKQLIHVGVATAKYEEDLKAREEASSFKDEFVNHVNSRLNKFEDFMNIVISNFKQSKDGFSQVMIGSRVESSSDSTRRPQLSQHLDNLFATVGVSRPPVSSPTPNENPPVVLCNKFGKELAKGYVVTDATAGTCHFKQVGNGEKKVYVEEVFDPDACLWDPPQGDHDTLAGFVQGGFLIWLDCWLKYI